MANTKTVLHPWPELVGPFPHGGNLNRALVVRGTEPSTVHPEDEKHEPRNVARFHLQSGLWVPNLGLPGSRRTTMMKLICGSISALALASALSITAHAQTSDAGIEFAFMPRTMTVTLLNEGGKYVAIDLKHIAQGGTCRMDKDATIARVGEGDRGMVRVRYAAAQISSGGCPFMTTFDIPAAEYAQGRAEFVAKKDEAWKVDEIKNDLGTKWEELTGKKG
jgi:hypothetical protein